MNWKTPLKILAENDGVKVRVEISVLSRATLTADEASHVKVGIAEAVMRQVSSQRYLGVPLCHQKVTGAD